MIRVFGIPNCDTVKRARAWLDAQGLAHQFVDFRREPPEATMVARWCTRLGPEALLNRRGTTWRRLDPATQAGAGTEAGVVALLVAHPSAIRRPVVEADGELWAGFDPDDWARRLGAPARP